MIELTRRRTGLLAAALALVATTLLPAAADARTANRTKPVVVVHGFLEGFARGVDCADTWGDFGRFLARHPVRPYRSGFDGVSFYVSADNPDNNCRQVSRRRRVRSLPLRGEHFGGRLEHVQTTSGDDGHDADTDVRHIAYHLAWYLHEEYTSRNRTVDIVAWSGGGLIVRYMLQQVDRRQAQFPPRLLVEDVVTMGSQHAGINPTLAALCGNEQCGQIAENSAFIRGLRSDGAGRHPNPINPNPPNDPRGRTDWTVMSSVDDLFGGRAGADGMPRADHRVRYGEDANYGHDSYFNDFGSDPGGGPDNVDVVVDDSPNDVNQFVVPEGKRRRGPNWITFALQFASS